MAAAYGMAVACVLGGVLNLFGLISPLSLLLYLIVGSLFCAASASRSIRAGRRGEQLLYPLVKSHPLLALAVCALVLVTLLHAGVPALNEHDDYHAYLAFPHQMLQTGGLQDDPFNHRRLGTLGGQSFLHAMMLTLVAYPQVGAVDKGVGWLLFIALVLTRGLHRRVSGVLLLWVLSVLHLAYQNPANISSSITAAALFYAFLRRFEDANGHREFVEVAKTALIFAALCSLKTSNVAIVGLVAVYAFLAGNPAGIVDRILQGAKVAAMALLLLLPWMYAMQQSSGTFLFPLLGRGTLTDWQHGAAVFSVNMSHISGRYLAVVVLGTSTRPTFLSGFMLVAWSLLPRARRSTERSARGLFFATVFAACALAFVHLGLLRHVFAFGLAAFAFVALEVLPAQQDSRRFEGFVVCALISGLLLVVGAAPLSDRIQAVLDYRRSESVPVASRFFSSAQNSVPAGVAIMAAMSQPYLLDFQRNTVYIIDHAGNAGPDPGLPVHGTAEELSRYLRLQRVNYLIFSHSDDAGYGYKRFGDRLRWRGHPSADHVRVVAENNFKFHRQLRELMRRYPVVYRDDSNVVIDLSDPIDAQSRAGEGFHGRLTNYGR